MKALNFVLGREQKKPATTRTVERASLLGLPRELRLQIYIYVIHADFSSRPGKRCLAKVTTQENATKPASSAPPISQLPWCSLMLSSSAIADELHALMKESSFAQNNENTTYALDLKASPSGTELENLVWKQLFCPPHQARVLVANIISSEDQVKFYRPGMVFNFSPILSSVFQALTLFLDCGPRMDSKNPLKKHLALEELVIVLHDGRGSIDHYGFNEGNKLNAERWRTWRQLCRAIKWVVEYGRVHRYVKKIKLECGSWKREWIVPEPEKSGLGMSRWMWKWHRLEFDWRANMPK